MTTDSTTTTVDSSGAVVAGSAANASAKMLPPRSALYMPASNPRAMAKGPSVAADAVIIDLEDSVAPDAKGAARAAAVEALGTLDYGHRVRALRINAADTPWFADDLAAAISAAPDVIVLPKVESAELLRDVSDALDTAPTPKHIRLWAMLETPLAVLRADEIAGVASAGFEDGRPSTRSGIAESTVASRLEALVIGANDLARAGGLSVSADRAVLLPWLMTFVAAAKAHELWILDAVFNDFGDTAGLERECAAGVAMGMDGKTVVHPTQIEPANRRFTPDAVAVAEAQAIVDAFAAPGAEHLGVLSLQGRMVERLHLEIAHRTLALAARDIERRQSAPAAPGQT